MVVRTITVTEEAYRRVKAQKREAESFSDVLLRLTKRKPLTDFAGVLSPSSAATWRSVIEADRAQRRLRDR